MTLTRSRSGSFAPRRSAPLLLALGLFLVRPPGEAKANVVILPPTKDNTLYQIGATNISNGGGDYLFVGRTDQGNLRRLLIRFDIAGSLPPGATINSVTLTMYTSRAKVNTGYSHSLYRVLADWGETSFNQSGQEGSGGPAQTNDVTWFYRFYPTQAWTTAGGDYNATPRATTTVGANGTSYTWTGANLVADVQAWLNNPATNFGWVVIGGEATNRSAKRFNSRTNGTNPPRLTIDYTPFVNNTGACCYPSGTCSVIDSLTCIAQSGVFQGSNTTCTPNPCPQPTGACCFNNGTCDTLTAAQCAAAGGTYQGDGTACMPGLCPFVLTPFVDALPIPPIATPTTGQPGGEATYDLNIVEVKQRLHRDLPLTTVWAYDSLYPGPTFLTTKGDPITVHWTNDLRDSTGALRTSHYLPVDLCLHGPDSAGATARVVTHLHGGHVPSAYDGYPDSTRLPGESDTYYYPNNQDASLIWYHDHAMGITRLNVIMGLAGGYIIRDPVENALNLPSGQYEVPLILQDRTFNTDGSFYYPATWEDHFFGDVGLVNGKVWPYLNVRRGSYRFRVLGGSTSRVYTLHLSNGLPFTVIGSDGGLLEHPVVRDSLTVAPGERYDVIVDFSSVPAGTEIILQNTAPAPFPVSDGMSPALPQMMKFVVQNQAGYNYTVPANLRTLERLQESAASQHRDLMLEKMSGSCAGSMWMINGLGFDDITEFPRLGSTEVWRFINRSGVVHPMHMHLVMFQVLDHTPFTVVGDSLVYGTPQPPDATQTGWKDTVPVYPNEALRVITRFEDYTGRYPYHCHIIEHEDHEMMRQFEVVDTLVSAVPETPKPPQRLVLSPGYPNPTTGRTRVIFSVPVESQARLEVFDVAGRKVATIFNGTARVGSNEVTWNSVDDSGRRIAAGLYLYQLRVPGYSAITRKLIVVN